VLKIDIENYFREVQAHSGRILVYVLPAILGAFVLNIPRFFDVLKVNVCEDFTHCGCGIVYSHYHTLTDMRLNKHYIIYYQLWTWNLLTGIIPLFILAILNWKIFSSIKKLRFSLRSDSQVNNRIATEVQLNPRKQSRTASIRSRRNQRNCKECNFAWVLLSTVIIFSVLHIPRILTSVYEAVTYSWQEKCQEKGLDYQPLWFTYSVVVINLCLVS